ncbi:MAG TPA: hypothetical protein PLC98_07670 [Anaerolineales bacterium]|nr:hypothetical protein [Anaerolineales bacterium]
MNWTFQLDPWSAARLTVTLVVVLTIPGWLILSLTRVWRDWPALTRWLVAVAISIAFFPTLYYLARLALPDLVLGRTLLIGGLSVGAGVAAWRLRRDWRDQFSFSGLEWVALAILAVTVATRFWLIRDWPFPASPDTLHHALITQITAQTGRLPYSLEPFFPIPLDLYHLGLHALAATVQNLAEVPAHAALLWLAQTLNGLGAIGVYVWLERRVGRLAAVVGLITAGLLSFQPALLTSWGRFTPLGSHAILFVAIWMVEVGLEAWLGDPKQRRESIWPLSVSGLLLAGVFLNHFRVAVYLIPLLVIVLLRAALTARNTRQLTRLASGVAIIGLVALALTGPVVLASLQAYYAYMTGVRAAERQAVAEIIQSTYYPFTLAWVNEAGMRYWLLGLGAVAAVFGWFKKQRLTQDVTFWVLALYAMGMAYVLNIPLLQFTNMTAILIALYLPVAVLLGVAAEALVASPPEAWRTRTRWVVLGLFLLLGANSARARATEYLIRYQYVRAEDIPAMNWIAANTPANAVFAVNTLYAHAESLFGTDAGYWIPYFTGRQTSAGAMIFALGPVTFRGEVDQMSRVVKDLEHGTATLDGLRAVGITHIYIGRAGNFSDVGLNLATIRALPGANVVFEQDGVAVIDIRGLEP